MSDKCKIEYSNQRVIKGKILEVINEGDHVAILACEQNLVDMIAALGDYAPADDEPQRVRCQELRRGMEQLLFAAFPPKSITPTL